KSGYAIQKPDVMLQIVLVKVSDVRVHAVIVKINVRFGIARGQPGLLHRHIDVVLIGGQFAAFRLLHPVIPVVGNGANKFVDGNQLLSLRQITGEPILGSDRTGDASSAGIVLVVIHQYDAVSG